MDTYNPEELKLLILNTREPLVFKHLLSSNLLNWSLKDWESKLKGEILEFRSGKFECTSVNIFRKLTMFNIFFIK